MSWESLNVEADLLLLKAAGSAGLRDLGKFLLYQAWRRTAAAGPCPCVQPGWALAPSRQRHSHSHSSDFTYNHTLVLHKPEQH